MASAFRLRVTLRRTAVACAKAVGRIALLLLIAVVLVAAVPVARHALLRTLGRALVARDALEPSEVGVMPEFGEGAELEIGDLYRRHLFSRVVVLESSPTEVDREFIRRGVYRDDIAVTTLRQLGVPDNAIVTVEAGEGGTTESADALVRWIRTHPSRAIVVVIPSHARRYRRTLLRAWPDGVPPPLVTYPRHNAFRAADWWTSRRTLRDGVFELQKLVWDYLQHPW